MQEAVNPVSFRLDGQTLKRIDAIAKRENRSRGAVLRRLIGRALEPAGKAAASKRGASAPQVGDLFR